MRFLSRPPSYAVPAQSYEHLALFAEQGYDPKSFKVSCGTMEGHGAEWNPASRGAELGKNGTEPNSNKSPSGYQAPPAGIQFAGERAEASPFSPKVTKAIPTAMTSPAIQFSPSPSGSKTGSADTRPCAVSSTGDGISLIVDDDDPLVSARGSFTGVVISAFLWLLILAPVFVWQCLTK